MIGLTRWVRVLELDKADRVDEGRSIHVDPVAAQVRMVPAGRVLPHRRRSANRAFSQYWNGDARLYKAVWTDPVDARKSYTVVIPVKVVRVILGTTVPLEEKLCLSLCVEI